MIAVCLVIMTSNDWIKIFGVEAYQVNKRFFEIDFSVVMEV